MLTGAKLLPTTNVAAGQALPILANLSNSSPWPAKTHRNFVFLSFLFSLIPLRSPVLRLVPYRIQSLLAMSKISFATFLIICRTDFPPPLSFTNLNALLTNRLRNSNMLLPGHNLLKLVLRPPHALDLPPADRRPPADDRIALPSALPRAAHHNPHPAPDHQRRPPRLPDEAVQALRVQHAL